VRVLLCDDHQLFAEALGDVLFTRGDDVVLTTSPDRAVELALELQPSVCVMDRSFPEGDIGADAARRLLQVSPRTAVLMLTGSADTAAARSALGAGVRGFLRKDTPLQHIVEALDQLAEGLLMVDPAVLRPEVSRSAGTRIATLTAREQEVLERMVHGESGQSMATDMAVSYSTMRTHVQNILAKLGVHSQLEAAAFAVEHGLVRPRAG
jgi:two-component system, NarL family, nitrate/nitrite response regulator NarL